MSLFALDPLWNDIYTAGGFCVGAVGLFVGVAGFWIAIVQIREARKAAEKGQEAAEAARDAANKTLVESKEAFERFVGANASKLLSELESAVNGKNWQVARLRCNDLAELIASLPATRNLVVNEIGARCVDALREIARQFVNLEARRAAKMSKVTADKWVAALPMPHTVLDHLRKPFREVNHGEIADRDARLATPGDGARSPQQDKGPASELGSGSEP